MAIFSFIDNEAKDFLRYDDGSIIMISTATWRGAKNWLRSTGKLYGFTKEGVKYFKLVKGVS
jgi:hypothetical protein